MRARALDEALTSTGAGLAGSVTREVQTAAARQVLDAIRQDERDRAALYARSMRNRADLAAYLSDRAGRHAVMELAGTARIGQMRATTQLEIAVRLVNNFPRVLELLEQGEMLQGTAEMLATVTRHASGPVQMELGRRISDELAALDAVDARELIVQTLLEVEADLGLKELEERQERARRGRGVWVKPVGDGMTRIGAEVDDLTAQRWLLDFEELVRAQAVCDRRQGVERTAQQRRADVFAELPNRQLTLIRSMQQGDAVADAGASVQERAVQLLSLPVRKPTTLYVHMAVTTLLDLDNCPGRIEGGGPIEASQLRALRPVADVRRVFVDPASGIPIAMDARLRPPLAAIDDTAGPHAPPRRRAGLLRPERLAELFEDVVDSQRPESQHDPSAALARFVKLRDQGCLGPGCPVPARRCELDHRIRYGQPGGETSRGNLHDLSPGCHHGKHDGWEVELLPDGSTLWRSPLGGVYRRRPRWLPPPLFRRDPWTSKPERKTPDPQQRPRDESRWDEGPPPF